jgi:hypothetical protein
MKTFTNQAAQGDMLLRRIDKLPEGTVHIAPEGTEHVLTHSETGHDHCVAVRPGLHHLSGMDVLRSFLVVPEGDPVPLYHKRDAHTHETLLIGPGIWEITRQREYDPTEGWKLAAD